jgi:hypothetical protein
VFGVGIFTAGAPDVPFASENDKPAAPNIGRALLPRFRFEVCFTCDMADSYTFGQCSDQSIATAIRKTVLGSIGRWRWRLSYVSWLAKSPLAPGADPGLFFNVDDCRTKAVVRRRSSAKEIVSPFIEGAQLLPDERPYPLKLANHRKQGVGAGVPINAAFFPHLFYCS